MSVILHYLEKAIYLIKVTAETWQKPILIH